MISLSSLKNTTKPSKRGKRVGRGPGSKLGKTCGRGEKGAGSRSGYRTRAGKEGGQLPLYRKLPCRGFTNGRFKRHVFALNFWQIEKFFLDGEHVNETTLRDRGVLKGNWDGIKILANGELTKKISVEVTAVSKSALEKLQQLGATVTLG